MNGFFPRGLRMGQRKACMGRWLRVRAGAAAAILFSVLSSARAAPEDFLSTVGILLDARITGPDVRQEIPGARDTVIVAARRTPSGLAMALSSKEWEAAALDWPQVLAAATARATRLEQSMTIQWHRDSRKVYQYAMIESSDPFISSVIYSPSFLERFRQFLGDEVLVAIPDRFSVFVFPRFGSALDEFGPGLVRRHKEAMFKVSLEVFLVDGKSTPRAIGKMGD